MKNVKIKLTVWGIIILAGIIFYWQNRSPEVALVIFGSETIALSVSLWLITGAIAGLITSILLQLLLGVYSPKRRRSRQWDDDDEEDSDFEFPEEAESTNERFASSNRSDRDREGNSSPNPPPEESLTEDWQSPPQREDWNDVDDDWNIEEPPRRDINPSPQRSNNFGNSYEVQNAPEKRSQQGSVYSYRYREASRRSNSSENIEEDENDNNNDEEEANQSPKVYEANYRVIRPPLWNLPDADDNWDEEEDDPDKR